MSIQIDTIKDYLGHPSQMAAARDNFEASFEEALPAEPRSLARDIGRHLNEISQRLQYAIDALETAGDALPSSTDSDQAEAVLAIIKPYCMNTANRFSELAGKVLAALHAAGIDDATPPKETSHG